MTEPSDWRAAAYGGVDWLQWRRARRQYRRAWTAASLGFILLIATEVLQSIFWARWYASWGRADFEALDNLQWLNSISIITSYAGLALMVGSIVFVLSGLMAETDKQRPAKILLGILGQLKLIALIALILYVVVLPVSILSGILGSYLILYVHIPAYLAIAALPLLIARALNKGSL